MLGVRTFSPAALELARQYPDHAEIIRLEVTDQANETVAQHIRQRHGHLHVLVNNAAIHYDTWQTTSNANFSKSKKRWTLIFSAPGGSRGPPPRSWARMATALS